MIIDKRKEDLKEYDFTDKDNNYLITVIAKDIRSATEELREINYDLSKIYWQKTRVLKESIYIKKSIKENA